MGYLLFNDESKLNDVSFDGYNFIINSDVNVSYFTKDRLEKISFYQDEVKIAGFYDAEVTRYEKYTGEDKTSVTVSFVSKTVIAPDIGVSYLAGLLLTDEQAVSAPFLFNEWDPDGVSYTAEVSKVTYNDLLYKCLQSHVSQASWNPKDAVSLWVRIDDPAIEWPEWRQPTGAHDAYPIGAKVSHNDKHWVSNVDNNVWEPGAYGWDEQVEESEL